MTIILIYILNNLLSRNNLILMDTLITSCIVLYKNDRNILLNTIQSFLNTNLDVKLYLIDNSPTSILQDIIIDERVEYIHNPLNPGFGASHNIAIKKAINIFSKFHLVLNPDIYFDEGTIEGIIEFMEKNIKVSLVMPKVLNPNGDIQYLCKKNPNFFDLFLRGLMPKPLKKYFKYRLDKYEYKDFNYEDIIFDVPYLSGCFMFFRTEIFNKIGTFDENIFMYLEDADITRRVLKVSHTAYYPQVFIHHHYSGLTHKYFKYKFITIQSAIVYFNKWGWLNK